MYSNELRRLVGERVREKTGEPGTASKIGPSEASDVSLDSLLKLDLLEFPGSAK